MTRSPGTVIQQIRSQYSEMTPSYRKIADYLVSHYRDAAFMPAARLAAEVGVSESMIVRFSADLGFGGYSGLVKELKEYVRRALVPAARLRHAPGADVTTPFALPPLVLEQDALNLHATANDFVNQSFGDAVEHLVAARHIYIIGLRGMSHLAILLGHLLEAANAETTVMTRGDALIYSQLRGMAKGDLLIAFAYSRYTLSTLDAIHFARSRNVPVLTVTDALTSPPAVLSDAVLRASVSSPSLMASHASGIAMVYALADAYVQAVPDRYGNPKWQDLIPESDLLSPEEVK